jgi:hypothetical protein
MDEGYNEIMQQAWLHSTEGVADWQGIKANLLRCQGSLVRWQKKRKGNLQQPIDVLRRRLAELQGSAIMGNSEEIKAVQTELGVMLDKADLQWRQRAKIEWLKCGDRNTSFFHACASSRRKANYIDSITDVQGRFWETEEEVQGAFINYFQTLFTSDNAGDMNQCLQHISPRVSDEMNTSLLKPFSREEVQVALNQMAPLKAPGPDGFTAGFYQKNWGLIGEDVCRAILGSLNSGIMPSFLNSTNIALIPKINSPASVSDFRPISLCNVMYKLISKVLANRLKLILNSIISPVQSAFIPGRLITDNVLAAYETLHTMQSRMGGKKGYMAVKLDMSKAYDRVEWRFLEAVMDRMGFASRWIHLIMMCVTSVQYAVMINGKPCGQIYPERGLRQGDPISPYLFLLCAEALSAMLGAANNEGILSGVPTSKRGPRLSHLFFADDSLLFCRANIAQWIQMTNVLRIYEEASGQKLNKSKTSIFFSRNTSVKDREDVLALSQLPATKRYDTYLGLPALVGKSRTTAFRHIVDRVWKKLQDWKLKFLSQAGREILLKAVIQAIPTYCMSVFLLPRTLCSEIDSLMRKFWWGNKENTSKINWMSWGRMGRSKSMGGMGFRDFHNFNKALLAKQMWRLWESPNSLVGQIMQAKYFPTSSVLEATKGKRISFAWRSILSAQELVMEGLVWRVGNGAKVRIWKDRWLPSPGFKVVSPPTVLNPDATVDQLIDGDSRWWNNDLLSFIFPADVMQVIQKIPISCTNQEDVLIWRGTKNGVFSVRSAYYIQQEMASRYEATSSVSGKGALVWKRIWALSIPNCEIFFFMESMQ